MEDSSSSRRWLSGIPTSQILISILIALVVGCVAWIVRENRTDIVDNQARSASNTQAIIVHGERIQSLTKAIDSQQSLIERYFELASRLKSLEDSHQDFPDMLIRIREMEREQDEIIKKIHALGDDIRRLLNRPLFNYPLAE